MNYNKYLKYATSTKGFLCSRAAAYDFILLLKEAFPSRNYSIIADENTWDAAGKELQTGLLKQGCSCSDPLIFQGKPPLHAEYRHVLTVADHIKQSGALPLAVGSGTLNDLVKRASFECNVSYAVYGTACSVDGYASDGAALLKDGLKQTMPCPAPVLIAADTDILLKAPYEMTAAGYADLVAKVTAGSDWIIADITGEQKIEASVWSLVQENLPSFLKDPGLWLKGDASGLAPLFEGLTASGFAMQYMKDSRPVSGAEHLISHILEMKDHQHEGQSVSHGFKVAIGTLTMEKFTRKLFEMDRDSFSFNTYPVLEKWIDTVPVYFDDGLLQQGVITTITDKYPSEETLKGRRKAVLSGWDDLKSRVMAQFDRFSNLGESMKAAGAPFRPSHISLSQSSLEQAILAAQMIRNRYTVLDLAHDLGVLEVLAKETAADMCS